MDGDITTELLARLEADITQLRTDVDRISTTLGLTAAVLRTAEDDPYLADSPVGHRLAAVAALYEALAEAVSERGGGSSPDPT